MIRQGLNYCPSQRVSEAERQAIAPLPCVAAPDPLLDPLCQITSFYRFVEHLAGALGFDPDAPQLLKKVTETL